MRLFDKPSAMFRRTMLWVAPVLLATTVFVVPVTNGLMKAFQLGLLAVTTIGWMIVLRKWKAGFRVALALLVLAGALLFTPGSEPASRPKLPQAYADALLRYQGVIYWWGGESRRGIDCSGLIRRGMMDAALREGLLTLDRALVRVAADLWWHDCSAEALGEGYRGYTLPVTNAESLNALDHTLVRQGDLAIAGGGAHILAYLGDKRWIQADPTAQSVVVESAPSRNGWFKGPVKIVRWRWLDPPRLSGQDAVP